VNFLSSDLLDVLIGFLKGAAFSTVFVLVIFIGFCVIVGFTKLKRTAGNTAVVKNLDEAVSHHAVDYLPPTAPRGPADQLKAPELLEAAARK
jgi:hypothetical protein